MALHYYDEISGRNRLKRRYLYAAIGFVGGTLFGLLVPHLL
ncbi:hypothetical protein [Hydrocarboniphaga sp.]